MLGSILKQLVAELPEIPIEIAKTFQENRRKSKMLELSVARGFLSLVVQLFDRAYICIDALDECEASNRRGFLLSLHQVSQRSMRLLVTGRPHIEAEVNKLLCLKSPRPLEIVANEHDIRRYVASKIEADLTEGAMNESLKEGIETSIAHHSQGM
jgi:hypothetical protein